MDKVHSLTQRITNFILKISEKLFPKKLFEIEKKVLTVEVFLYVFFGVLTTLVNVGIFSALTYVLHVEENLSNTIAIIIAVLFAYFSNKKIVFHSEANTFKQRIYEFLKFILGRAFTMIVELLGFYLLFNKIGIYKLVSKIIITVIVIILNFFISKFFAFKKSK
jgi:putative flippase GtrA